MYQCKYWGALTWWRSLAAAAPWTPAPGRARRSQCSCGKGVIQFWYNDINLMLWMLWILISRSRCQNWRALTRVRCCRARDSVARAARRGGLSTAALALPHQTCNTDHHSSSKAAKLGSEYYCRRGRVCMNNKKSGGGWTQAIFFLTSLTQFIYCSYFSESFFIVVALCHACIVQYNNNICLVLKSIEASNSY